MVDGPALPEVLAVLGVARADEKLSSTTMAQHHPSECTKLSREPGIIALRLVRNTTSSPLPSRDDAHEQEPHADLRVHAMSTPTLVVVSGGPGTGKTTLAHGLARILGCPAIIRDEIKQGMVLSHSGYQSGGDDLLNLPTLHAFFGTLNVLLKAGVTLVAEAAFQDRLWRPNLELLTGLAHVRVIHCTTAADIAHDRIVQRTKEDRHRAAHGDQDLLDAIAAGEHSLDSFVPISLDVPALTVDTSDGYQPRLHDIADFALAPVRSRTFSGGRSADPH